MTHHVDKSGVPPLFLSPTFTQKKKKEAKKQNKPAPDRWLKTLTDKIRIQKRTSNILFIT